MQLKYRGQSYVPSHIPASKPQTTSLQFMGQSYSIDGSYQPAPKMELKPVLQFRGCSYAMA